MVDLYQLSREDYRLVKLLLPYLDETDNSFALRHCAFHLSQAYESLFKAFLLKTRGSFPEKQSLQYLYDCMNHEHQGIKKHLNLLSEWKASSRYEDINIRVEDINLLTNMYQDVYDHYSITVIPAKTRVKNIFDMLYIDMDVNLVLPLLPSTLPEDDESLVALLDLAIKSLH